MEKLKGLDLENKLVLDAGTGACGMTKYLREWGADVVSIDYNPEWQKNCREEVDKAQFITADLNDIPFLKENTFDFVVCNFLISALSESKDLLLTTPLREFYRVLKNEGMLIIIDYKCREILNNRIQYKGLKLTVGCHARKNRDQCNRCQRSCHKGDDKFCPDRE